MGAVVIDLTNKSTWVMKIRPGIGVNIHSLQHEKESTNSIEQATKRLMRGI